MEHIKQLIGGAKIAEAITEAISSNDFKNHLNELLLISGQYAKNELDNNRGVLDSREYELARNRVVNSFLSLIDTVESDNKTSVGLPKISDETKNNFQLLATLFAGEKSPGMELRRVEGLSWDNNNEFLLTSCLSSDTIKVWHVQDGRLAFTIKGNANLCKAQFDQYDSSVWSVEDNRYVVVWKKQTSNENRYGVYWEREKEIHLPDQFKDSYIKEVLYKVDLNKTYTYALVQNKDNPACKLIRFKRDYNDEKKDVDFFEYINNRDYFNARLKFLTEGRHNELAILHGNDEITIWPHDDVEPPAEIYGYDVAAGESRTSFIYISSAYRTLSITLWNSNKPNPVQLGYTSHWNSTLYSTLVTKNRFSLIESKSKSIVASNMYSGELYSFVHQFNKKGEIEAIYGSKIGAHKKKITRIDLDGPAYNFELRVTTTSSEDGTIGIWHRAAIGHIYNCHPYIHPFKWSHPIGREAGTILAYADVDGFVHLLKFLQDPFDQERKEDKLATRAWFFLKKPLNLILLIGFVTFARMIIFGEHSTSTASFIFNFLPIIGIFALRKYLRMKIEGY